MAVRDHRPRQREARRLPPGRCGHGGVPARARRRSRPISAPPTPTRWSSPPAARWRSTSPPTPWPPRLRPGDEILLSRARASQQHRALADGRRARAVPASARSRSPRTGGSTYDRLDELVTERTRIIAVTHASNVTGAVTEVGRLREAADAVGALLVLDGAQRAPHGPLDVQALGCDLYAFSGPQDVRPDRRRCPVGPQGAPGRAAAVPGRRRDDPPGRDRALDLRPAAAPLRGRHARRSAPPSAWVPPPPGSPRWTGRRSAGRRWS